MEAAIPFFTGSDYDVHPHDFLRLFRRVEKTDDARIQQFVNYLQAGSVADEWWDGLGDDVKSSWRLVEVEFGRRWPLVPLARKTSARCLEELLAMKLPSSTLGMTERYSARVVYSHVGWASRMMELARGAGIMDSGAYLGSVIRGLPWPVRQLVRRKYETWGAFLEGVQFLEMEVLEDWMEVGKRRGRVPVAGKHQSVQTCDRSLPASALHTRAQDWRRQSPVAPREEDCSPTAAPVLSPASETTRHWVPESLPRIPNNGDENIAAVRSSEGDSQPGVVSAQLAAGVDGAQGDSGFEMPGAWRDGDGRCGRLINRVVTRTQAVVAHSEAWVGGWRWRAVGGCASHSLGRFGFRDGG
ncbi:hypothetical protein DFP72DRAFT_881912 [Ephemerocybe angulata]|uniref:Uncharacterized protein n=1 Tax=Ephemerocybe angulata TaxID=980116 RepID=A0A8H6MAC9_9AGAR|nr:hypothetical protein DFP72DRAFT_881912 [Tulosesus angulatus]